MKLDPRFREDDIGKSEYLQLLSIPKEFAEEFVKPRQNCHDKNMHRGFTLILILVIVAISVIGAFIYQRIKPVICTADAKICPDGSLVGRRGPNCEFTPCPSSTSYPMEMQTTPLCDLDADGKCDGADLNLIKQALGTHQGERGYSLRADLDADGVVAAADEQLLLKLLDQNLSADIANWKTYTNKNYSYSIKYPQNLKPLESTSDLYLIKIDFEDGSQTSLFNVEVRNNNLKNEIIYLKSKIVGHVADNIKNETNITKDSYQGVKLEYDLSVSEPNIPNSYTVVVINNGKYSYSISSPSNFIDQILSTFKFLD